MKPLRFLTVLAAGCIAVGGARAAINPSAWEVRQSVALAGTGPARFALTPALLDAARADLADLRLLAPDGAEVPFAAWRSEPPAALPGERIAVVPRLAARETVIEVPLEQPRPLAGLQIVTPAASFVKGLTIETRNAAGEWSTFARDVLVFRLPDGSAHLEVDLGGTEVQTLRLRLDDERDPAVPVTHVVLVARREPAPPTRIVPVRITAKDTTAGETRLALDLGLRHRKLATLTLAVREPVFERQVRLLARTVQDGEVSEQTLATGTIRRLALPGGRGFSELAVNIEALAPAAQLELAIDNGDSPPLTIEGVSVTERPAFLAFQADALGSFTLLAGNPAAAKPRYDVAGFAAQWAQVAESRATMGELEKNPEFRPPAPTPEVPEFAGAFDADGWTRQREVAVETPGAQVLELDPEVLARARPDLGDVRLVRDGRQVPYLVERTGRHRVLPLAHKPDPHPERPRLGRWRLELPAEGVPLSRVTVEVSEPVFERRVALSEEREDARGQRWRHELGETTWTRRGPEGAGKFDVALHTAPAGGSIHLEIEHGENAPFAPVSVAGAYPLVRLRFRAGSPGAFVLHYGNPGAGAPRYDLQLAAPALLAAREHPAVLAPAAAGQGVERSGFKLGGRAARFAFWGALTLVVVVLLWLVARMLPKAAAD